jgi:hypothetical protein
MTIGIWRFGFNMIVVDCETRRLTVCLWCIFSLCLLSLDVSYLLLLLLVLAITIVILYLLDSLWFFHCSSSIGGRRSTTASFELFLSRLFLFSKEFQHAFALVGSKVGCLLNILWKFPYDFLFSHARWKRVLVDFQGKDGLGDAFSKDIYFPCGQVYLTTIHRTRFRKEMAVHS